MRLGTATRAESPARSRRFGRFTVGASGVVSPVICPDLQCTRLTAGPIAFARSRDRAGRRKLAIPIPTVCGRSVAAVPPLPLPEEKAARPAPDADGYLDPGVSHGQADRQPIPLQTGDGDLQVT